MKTKLIRYLNESDYFQWTRVWRGYFKAISTSTIVTSLTEIHELSELLKSIGREACQKKKKVSVSGITCRRPESKVLIDFIMQKKYNFLTNLYLVSLKKKVSSENLNIHLGT